jgi:putative hemolysin
MFAVRIIGVLALVALNGFFAAAEFSLVAVRLSRVRQLVQKGNVRAKIVEALLGDVHYVVSGVQLGITLTSLALGALGESTLASTFQTIWPMASTRATLFVHAVALAGAFALLSALHVVVGELVPKTVSLARAERVALLVARPFSWFLKTFRWAPSLRRWAFPSRTGTTLHTLQRSFRFRYSRRVNEACWPRVRRNLL